MKKDVRVELLRIIGALIVIGVHTCLPMIEGECLDRGRALIAAFFADGVAIFWCISGFFMFDNYSYKHVMKRTLKSVIVPLMIFNAFLFVFGNHKIGISDLFHHLLKWENPFNTHLQLWYLYVYILLMIVSPVVYSFLVYLKENEERENYFLTISFIFLLLNDVSNNQLAAFSHHTINALVPAMILMIWGNIIYRRIKAVDFSVKHILIATFVFVLNNILRWWIQIYRFSNGVDGIHIYFWFSSIAVINVCCMIIAAFALGQKIRNNERCVKITNSVSSYTFIIYMLHILVYITLQKFINFERAYLALCKVLPTGEGFLSEILYVIIVVSVIFLVSMLCGFCIRGVVRLFLRKRK